jgi:CO/xanthine dehydrogenase FAD-binding subunit
VALVDLPLHDFERVSDLPSLCSLLAERSAQKAQTILLAGGTDWIVERHMAPPDGDGTTRPLVVDVSRLEELRGISVADGTVTIGAATTYLEIRRHALLATRAPLLGRMSKDVGAVQIQARGTLGGNLATASPAADGVAALAALDATLILASTRGERRVALGDFYTGYKRTVRADDELIRAVTFTLPRPGAVTYWRKVGTRAAQAISKVALAGVAEITDGRLTRVGLGMASVAPTTAFLPTVRTLALDTPVATLTKEMLRGATDDDIAPIDDVRSTAAYRRHVARALVVEFFRTLV